jgi:hypothetical protein
MKDAPHGALYIWVHRHSLAYANALAAHLGRTDLEITAVHILDEGGRRLHGLNLLAIIVDHAANLTDRQFDVLEKFRDLIRAQQPKASNHQS